MSGQTDQELMAKAQSLHQSIFVDECFGSHDVYEYDAILAELEQRGYEAVETLGFVKREEA